MLECHFRRRQIAPSYPSHTANSDQAARCVHTPPTESHFPYGAISEGSLTAQLPPRDRLSNQPNAQDMSEAIRSCIQDFDAVSWSMVTLTTPSSATAHSKQEKMPPLRHVRKRAAEGPQLRRNYTVFFHHSQQSQQHKLPPRRLFTWPIPKMRPPHISEICLTDDY